MFVVDHILISDEIAEAQFACNLGACHGACCVQGDSGAPLEEDELSDVDDVLSVVIDCMRPEARSVVDRAGAWERTASGGHATTCIGDAECVFVRYDGPVAKCLIQEAHDRGETDFPKPISCHLYPIRVEDLGDFDALNYEQMDMCIPGRKKGVRSGKFLSDFLRDPLTRRYGQTWYEKFKAACQNRRSVFADILRPTS